MNDPIYYIDRVSQEKKEEKIYFEKTLRFFYSSFFGKILGWFIANIPLFSSFFGFWQKLPFSKKKIIPFISCYKIDPTEFEEKIENFTSFNDFFTRKLRPETRPLNLDKSVAIIPADGRYLFFQNIEKSEGFLVKGHKFSLQKLLNSTSLANRYAKGTMAIARLCPTDYHRYHFPFDCLPSHPQLINGPLYSVNPIAIRQTIERLSENKRVLTILTSKEFEEVLFIEIGATNVGTINQTFTPYQYYKKGDEKGFFSFGGSSIILLFKPNIIQIDDDLLNNSSQYIETLCLMGQSMGRKMSGI